jgi:hypothetical protein
MDTAKLVVATTVLCLRAFIQPERARLAPTVAAFAIQMDTATLVVAPTVLCLRALIQP